MLSTVRKSRTLQRGSILLALLIFLALAIIALGVAAPRMAQQIRRDREEEMIHRGAQYARAIKRYHRKFQRYPGSIEQLLTTNNIHFLRKAYKDPMTPDGKWKLVRFGDAGLGNLGAVGSNPFAGAAGGSVPPPPSPRGTTEPPNAPGEGTSSSPFSGQTFGGGSIIGVVSMSEATGIREFNDKRTYNQWYFIYDPAQDRGALIKGPYNPKAFMGNTPPIGTPAGQPPPSFGPRPQPQPRQPPQ